MATTNGDLDAGHPDIASNTTPTHTSEADTLQIRIARINHLAHLQQVARTAFTETFSAVNTTENMNAYLEHAFSTQQLTAELNDEASQFYLAQLQEKVIGYLKINFGPAQTELRDGKGVEIERIYVLHEFHGRKAGQALYDKAMQVAREVNAEFIWLGVWEKNTRAISFYRKNGFVEFDKHQFRLGNDEQTDLMMKRVLIN